MICNHYTKDHKLCGRTFTCNCISNSCSHRDGCMCPKCHIDNELSDELFLRCYSVEAKDVKELTVLEEL
jgi:hypothetical protein